MCARIAQTLEPGALTGLLPFTDPENLLAEPRVVWNGAPGASYATLVSPVIGRQPTMRELHWGLIPEWARDDGFESMNARSETASTKPSFREAFHSRRCILPVGGWFEWTGPRNRRQPYYVQAEDGTLMALAGLWEPARPGGHKGPTFAVLTTTPRDELESLHPRQPSILQGSQILEWLDPEPRATRPLLKLAASRGEQPLRIYPVDRAMNNTRYSSAASIEPIALNPTRAGSGKLFDSRNCILNSLLEGHSR